MPESTVDITSNCNFFPRGKKRRINKKKEERRNKKEERRKKKEERRKKKNL
jgi:hypothetical protein